MSVSSVILNLMQLTDEQKAVVDASLSGTHVIVEAGAGAGKTSTLVACADALPDTKYGLYLSFTKAIVEEAEHKFPSNIACRTAHSLAMKAIRQARSGDLLHARDCLDKLGRVSRQSMNDVALALDLRAFVIDRDHVLREGIIARTVMETMSNFLRSADEEPGRKHMPHVKGLDLVAEATRSPERPEHNALWKHISLGVAKAWEDINNPNGRLKFEHNHYLKMFQLTHPRINADFLFFDEAQDANPVMAAILTDQLSQPNPPQLIVVGDSAQAIYGWNGAVDAIAMFRERFRNSNTNYSPCQLTQSWRFGPAVADVANVYLEYLSTSTMQIKGNPAMQSSQLILNQPSPGERLTILSRTNAYVIQNLIEALAADIPTAVVGGDGWARTQIGLLNAMDELYATNSTNHPELAGFADWNAFTDYVTFESEAQDLRPLYNLYSNYGHGTLVNALERTTSNEKDAQLILSTGHKAKGREWEHVAIDADFSMSVPIDGYSDEMLALLYVVATRAQQSLDVTAIFEDIKADPKVCERLNITPSSPMVQNVAV